MNALSWLLYIGNVAGNIGTICGITSGLLFLLSFILWILYLTKAEPSYSSETIIKRSRAPIAATFVAFMLGCFACLAPSQTTVYAMAASELGERVIKTPVAGKAEQALEAWLDKQIASSKDDDKKKDKTE